MKTLTAKEGIYDQDDNLTGLIMENNERLSISQTNYKEKFFIKDVLFFVPPKDGKFMKLVESQKFVEKQENGNGLVKELPPYYRYGVVIEKGILVTRTFYCLTLRSPNGTEYFADLFGKHAIGDVRIVEAKTEKGKRIIINFYPHLKQKTENAKKEVKIKGKKTEKTFLSMFIPGTKEMILVNNLH